MKITRVWAYPNKWTFQIKLISKLIKRYAGNGSGWVDPFAGMYSPAEFTNDLNPEMPTSCHLPVIDFCNILETCNGALFDPPYSSTQAKVCYKMLLYKPHIPQEDFLLAFDNVKDKLSKLIKPDGYCISCGWNSNGLGKKRGFEIIEVLLVAHGGHHNDTIVTVERKLLPNFYNNLHLLRLCKVWRKQE